MTENDFSDPDSWYDFGLCDHLEDRAKFKDWLAVANEGIRILGVDTDSPGAHAIRSIAAAAAKCGYDDDDA